MPSSPLRDPRGRPLTAEDLRKAVVKLTAERDALLAELDGDDDGVDRSALARLRAENAELEEMVEILEAETREAHAALDAERALLAAARALSLIHI